MTIHSGKKIDFNENSAVKSATICRQIWRKIWHQIRRQIRRKIFVKFGLKYLVEFVVEFGIKSGVKSFNRPIIEYTLCILVQSSENPSVRSRYTVWLSSPV